MCKERESRKQDLRVEERYEDKSYDRVKGLQVSKIDGRLGCEEGSRMIRSANSGQRVIKGLAEERWRERIRCGLEMERKGQMEKNNQEWKRVVKE